MKLFPSLLLLILLSNFSFSQKDTTYHYYINGAVSVKIFPKEKNEQKIILYNLYGEPTYELKNIWHSYSVVNHLTFHENGAVKLVITSTNPGASRYMYKTETTFGSTNKPELQIHSKSPASLNEIMAEKPYFWNDKQKKWVQQEVIKCDNPPPGSF